MNPIDLVIIIVLILHGLSGMLRGFLIGLVELGGIVVSIAIPFLLYIPAGRMLIRFGVSPVYSNALGFLILWIITLNLYYFVSRRIYKLIPKAVRSSWSNRILGIIPGLVKGLLISAIVLTILTALPISLIDQHTIETSKFAEPMIGATSVVAGASADIFGEAVQNFMGFMTVQPKGHESVDLRFKVKDPRIDPQSEAEMLLLLNKERVQKGLKPLVIDNKLLLAARAHSTDMLQRGYFAHNTPEGVTPFDRMRRAGVRSTFYGENLAFAPTVNIAHKGLMNSPGHRENILRPQFRRVGIGAVRGGRFGIMFSQDFSN